MNLIEQLGGYEKAKEKRDGISHTLDNSELLGGGDAREGLYERLESIDKALLEYRRQHNIFEVGDFIFHPMFGALFEIKRIAEKYVVASTKSGYETNLLIELISHATDAEIKAGKRLEVKSDS